MIDINDLSMDELNQIGKEAAEKARQESIDAGLEVWSKDDKGRTIADKKDSDGKIITEVKSN